MKKISLLLLAIILLVSSFDSGLAFAKTYTVRLAYSNNPGEPLDIEAHKWAELAKKYSKGELILKLYPSGQLGAEKDTIEQAKMGMNIISISNYGNAGDVEPDLGILYGPYLTKTADEMFGILKTEWFAQERKKLANKGISLVGTNWLYGARQLLTVKPVNTPADLKGLKIRTPNNHMIIQSIKAMGAVPTPIPLSEAYTALTQGIIEGVENPVSVLYGQKLHEKAKYMTMISYINNISTWVAGTKYIKKLPKNIVNALLKSAFEAGEFSQVYAKKLNHDMIAEMEKTGVTVTYPNLKPFQELAQKVYTQNKNWSPKLYERIQKELKSVNKSGK